MEEKIHRIFFAETGYILDLCENGGADIPKSIHEIRKSIKRIRAVLRLIRDEIGYSTYYRENVFYRDINRRTSELRSAEVLTHTLDKLAGGLQKIDPGLLEPLREAMTAVKERLLAETGYREILATELAGKIKTARERILKLPIEHEGFEVFRGGLQRTYRKGRKYLRASRQEPGTEILHDLRKKVKYLWHHMEVLNPVYPELLSAYACSLEELSGKLGDYHDIAVLQEYIAQEHTRLRVELRQTLVDACIFNKSALLPDIFSISEAVYAEKPGEFIQRMEHYWSNTPQFTPFNISSQ